MSKQIKANYDQEFLLPSSIESVSKCHSRPPCRSKARQANEGIPIIFVADYSELRCERCNDDYDNERRCE